MTIKKRPPDYDRKIALVLQGGGALGSYQCGVFEALEQAEYDLNWVAGISIGAINAALIAGNEPKQRVDKMRQFWTSITTPSLLSTNAFHQFSALQAIAFGQPNFFAPRQIMEWWHGSQPTSYYDTRALKSTLERFVDFDRINARAMRFSVGAVNVRTGNFAYFDTAEINIASEHVMASAALPPAFPAVEIDGEHYWDGGLVSNTPLQHVLEYYPRRSHLIFQVDLFPARGPLPATLSEVVERDKDIRYSSRTRAVTDNLTQLHDLRHSINLLWEKLPDELRAAPEAKLLDAFRCVTTMDIVELIYRPDHPLGQSKDFDFDRSTMEARWQQGRLDGETALRVSPWLEPIGKMVGSRTFDIAEP